MGDLLRLLALLSEHSSTNSEEEAPPLWKAANDNDAEELQTLLQTATEEEVNAKHDQIPPLVLAAREGSLDCVRILVNDPKCDNTAVGGEKENALQWAAAKGNTPMVRFLMDNAPELELGYADKAGNTALMHAIQRDNTETASVLLQHMKPEALRAANKQGHTAVHLCCYHANSDCLGEVLKTDPTLADLEGDIQGDTVCPLHIAVDKMNVVLLEKLLPYVTNPNKEMKHHMTPLTMAARRYHKNNSPTVVKLLLEHPKLNLHARDEEGDSALSNLCYALHKKDEIPQGIKVGELLIERGLSMSDKNSEGKTPYDFAPPFLDRKLLQYEQQRRKDDEVMRLCKACEKKDVERVTEILETFPVEKLNRDPAVHCLNGLQQALKDESIDIIKLLLETGHMDLSVRSGQHGTTAWHFACAAENVDCMQLLMDTLPTDEAQREEKLREVMSIEDNAGRVPLSHALIHSKHAVAFSMEHNLWHYAPVNLKRRKVSHMYLCLEKRLTGCNNTYETFQMIASLQGIDLSITDGMSYLQMVVRGHAERKYAEVILQHESIVNKLEYINYQKEDGWTAAHLAAANGHPEPLKLLIDNGAYVTLVNKNKKNILHYACNRVNLEIINMVLDSCNDATLKKVLNQQDKKGKTCFHNLVSRWSQNIMGLNDEVRQDIIKNVSKTFCERGASVSICNDKGNTVIDSCGSIELATILDPFDNKPTVEQHGPKCVVCMARSVKVALAPCGHYGFCSVCAKVVKQCPICRERIKSCLTIVPIAREEVNEDSDEDTSSAKESTHPLHAPCTPLSKKRDERDFDLSSDTPTRSSCDSISSGEENQRLATATSPSTNQAVKKRKGQKRNEECCTM